ncbi:DUF2656 domain-containing protein [Nostoc sp. CENA67]|uniref:DUF2656 domain-containing protein n=2 Tax=Amazonocrinis TaxID=2840440 RepID=A0A8J7HVY9_9NOST|nr:DUF2656 domain-containing protein [Amazonocrinis nigriterrae CENA67]
MLLSHNFDVSTDIVPALSREEFAQVFMEGLSVHQHLKCRLVNNPHWIVEVLFATEEFSPRQVGELCANALFEKRQLERSHPGSIPEILVLGGIKTTPPTSSSPDALQPGNWGVDVVETLSSDAFLQAIAWDTAIAQKPADSIFKVELKN